MGLPAVAADCMAIISTKISVLLQTWGSWELLHSQGLELYPGNKVNITAVAEPDAGRGLLQGVTASHLSIIIWLSLVIPHLVIGLWIMCLELSGQLEPYRLHRLRNTASHQERSRHGAVLQNYVDCIPSLCMDFGVILPPILYAVCSAYTISLVDVKLDGLALCLEGCKLVAAYLTGRVWAMGVHYLMHMHPMLYKHVHKFHHQGVYKMCALAAWRDHPMEFLFMEVPSIYLLAIAVFKLNVFSVCLLCAYHGITAAVDHSGIHASPLLDGRYHFVHHASLNFNYAELEWLDKICGTHAQFKPRLVEQDQG